METHPHSYGWCGNHGFWGISAIAFVSWQRFCVFFCWQPQDPGDRSIKVMAPMFVGSNRSWRRSMRDLKGFTVHENLINLKSVWPSLVSGTCGNTSFTELSVPSAHRTKLTFININHTHTHTPTKTHFGMLKYPLSSQGLHKHRTHRCRPSQDSTILPAPEWTGDVEVGGITLTSRNLKFCKPDENWWKMMKYSCILLYIH